MARDGAWQGLTNLNYPVSFEVLAGGGQWIVVGRDVEGVHSGGAAEQPVLGAQGRLCGPGSGLIEVDVGRGSMNDTSQSEGVARRSAEPYTRASEP